MKWLNRFNLTETERKGFVVLLVVLAVLVLFRIGMAFWPADTKPFKSNLKEELAIWEQEQIEKLKVSKSFDPNTVSDSIISQFQISDFAKKNWLAFRTKGRSFKERIDVLNIYGMDSTWYEINQDSIFIADLHQSENATKEVRLFVFDPNTINQNGLEQLGVPEWLAKRIIKYRTSGGRFKEPKDLLKIYDFPTELYESLEPYISIQPINEAPIEESETAETLVTFNLNTVDSLQLISVKGIGPTFASRIIAYRNRLGGFVNLSQLTEVYGLDEEKVNAFMDRFYVESPNIVKLNINQATFKELVAHPYLEYNQVKVLVRYRETVGDFENLQDLLNLEHFKAKDVERLSPYFSVE